MIDEVEIPESVYNSNAIENSTLTLEETEKILLEQMLSGNVSVREVFEAVNLARVIEYQRKRTEDTDLGSERIGAIDDDIAGRFRRRGEYVRKLELPPLIIRNSEKQTYYRAFRKYTDRKRTATMERILTLALLESLHKRRSYLRGQRITTLADYVRQEGMSAPAVTNAARRQTKIGQ